MASLKDIIIEIFNQAGFKVHKWHSNVSTLEEKEIVTDDQNVCKTTAGSEIKWN